MNNKYTVEDYYEAKKAVNAKIYFYLHLIVFILVNAYLHIINLKNHPNHPYWAYWPLIGWSIYLLLHYIYVFSFFNNTQWKQKQIQKELNKKRLND